MILIIRKKKKNKNDDDDSESEKNENVDVSSLKNNLIDDKKIIIKVLKLIIQIKNQLIKKNYILQM